MHLYAELPARRARQLLADLLLLVWVGAAIAVGAAAGLALWRIGDRTTSLAAQTASAAGQLRSSADTVASVPLVGGQVATPLRSLGQTFTSLGGALQGDTATLHRAGIAFGVAVAVLGVAVPVLAWCLTRGRWVRRAGALRGRLGEDDLEALAVAAVATAGLRTLHRLPAGTVLAWRAGDPAARRAVAALGLRSLGLRPRG